MPLPALKIAILHYQPKGDEVDPVVTQLTEALTGLGHQVTTVAVDDRVSEILRDIQRAKCDLVFNVCETFASDYRMEVNVAALMEMGRVKYTGSSTAGLLLAQDKVLTKQLLEFHEVSTPNFAVFENDTFETKGILRFPLIVKPARSDASIGIGRHSVVQNWQELTERVREIRDDLQDEALVEEFIDGREVYVGIVGPASNPTILPIIEMDFGNWSPAVPMVSDREVKFAPETEGSPRLVIAKDLSDELRARIHRAARLAYRALKLRDYARMDFRIAKTGEPYMLEANPNPYLEKTGELAMAAEEAGLDYAPARVPDPRVRGRAIPPAHPRGGRKARPRSAVLTARTPGLRRRGPHRALPAPRCGRLTSRARVCSSGVARRGADRALAGDEARHLPSLEVEEDDRAVRLERDAGLLRARGEEVDPLSAEARGGRRGRAGPPARTGSAVRPR